MDLSSIRRIVVTAIASDDVFFEQLVLKGGNALDLVHGLGARSSIDVDYSMAGDFEDLDDVRGRLERALHDRFDAHGYAVFDLGLFAKPSVPRAGQSARWGGYRAEFKIILAEVRRGLAANLETTRRNATVTGPNQQRTFTIDFSKYEYCAPKMEATLDSYSIYVYTPAMIAAEKLRAICQQMPEYPLVRHRARARDFYDIHAIVTEGGVHLDSADGLDLLKHVFAAKDVPLSLLARIRDQRATHELDWAAVLASVPASRKPRDFDFYFDFVVDLTSRLESLWEE